YPEPRNLDAAFRNMTQPFDAQPATKAVGDCVFLAYAKEVQATLVTFDHGLGRLARKYGHGAVIPAGKSAKLSSADVIRAHGPGTARNSPRLCARTRYSLVLAISRRAQARSPKKRFKPTLRKAGLSS